MKSLFGWTLCQIFFLVFSIAQLSAASSPIILQQAASAQTIDSGAVAKKSTTTAFSPNSVKIQPYPFKDCVPETLCKCCCGIIMTHTFGNAGFWSLLLLSYHCCVSAQTFELALQNTL